MTDNVRALRVEDQHRIAELVLAFLQGRDEVVA